MIQETKKPFFSKHCFNKVWGGRNKDWISSPSLGSVGRMMIAWKFDLFKLEAVEHGSYSMWSKFSDNNLGFSWWISYIYDHASNYGKEDFWVELND